MKTVEELERDWGWLREAGIEMVDSEVLERLSTKYNMKVQWTTLATYMRQKQYVSHPVLNCNKWEAAQIQDLYPLALLERMKIDSEDLIRSDMEKHIEELFRFAKDKGYNLVKDNLHFSKKEEEGDVYATAFAEFGKEIEVNAWNL